PIADTNGSDPRGENLPIGPFIVAHEIGRRRCRGKRPSDYQLTNSYGSSPPLTAEDCGVAPNSAATKHRKSETLLRRSHRVHAIGPSDSTRGKEGCYAPSTVRNRCRPPAHRHRRRRRCLWGKDSRGKKSFLRSTRQRHQPSGAWRHEELSDGAAAAV